ncbi:hypothetical protein C4565_03670 [Candidatus Parcubacteria bacterium]|nr:MAG: hypothetical protein C4565_03670 [Candidatus Parcubacteria bacterium]
MSERDELLAEIRERAEHQSELDDLIRKIESRRKATSEILEHVKSRYKAAQGTVESVNKYKKYLEWKLHRSKEKIRSLHFFLDSKITALTPHTEAWELCKEVFAILNEEKEKPVMPFDPAKEFREEVKGQPNERT